MVRYCFPFLLGLSLMAKVKLEPLLSWKVPAALESSPVQSKIAVPGPVEAEEAGGAAEEAGVEGAAARVEAGAVPADSTGPISTSDAPSIWGEKLRFWHLLKSIGCPAMAVGGV